MVEKATLRPGLILSAATITGWVSMILFVVFLFTGSPGLVHMGFSESDTLAWDGMLSLLFFTQHSVMIRKEFRSRFARIIAPHYHGAVFAIASGAVLILLMVLWQPSAITLYELRSFPRWLARSIFFLGIAGLAWGALSLRSFDPFGVAAIKAYLSGELPRPQCFVVRGPYRWARHPLYFIMLLLIWSSPDMTADRLLFNCFWSLWIFAGTILEEADLLSEFGEAYRDYQHKAPMLIPWRKPFSISSGFSAHKR